MNGELSQEDQTILAAFGALENGEDRVPGIPASSEAGETLARLYTEVMGLVPYELAPAAPSPDLKARLMARVAGAASVGAESPAAAAPAPLDTDETQEVEPRPDPRPPVPLSRPAQPSQPSQPAQELRPPVGRVAMVPERRSVWPFGLAAALVVLLGGLAGWLGMRNLEQQQTIAQLQGDLAEAQLEAKQSTEAKASFERMRENFALVTTPAVTVMPLRPAAAGEVQMPENARGLLYVAADHQHWYLAVHGLPPAAEGRTYQLWWDAEGVMVSGGTFDPRQAGEKVELSSKTMPANTRDVVVTLEPDGGATAPSGPEVLRAAGVYQIL